MVPRNTIKNIEGPGRSVMLRRILFLAKMLFYHYGCDARPLYLCKPLTTLHTWYAGQTGHLQIDHLQVDRLQVDHLQIDCLHIYHLQIDIPHIYHLQIQIDELQI